MNFKEKIKTRVFWKKVVLKALSFFIALTLFSLIMSDVKAFFSLDFNKISELNFNNGKWKSFFGVKLVVCIIYGILTADRNKR